MKKSTYAILATLGALIINQQVVLADNFVVTCPHQATNLTLYRQTLENKALGTINTGLYSSPRAHASLRLVSIDTTPSTNSVDSILDGITFLSGSTPDGLTVSVSGSAQFLPICHYTYRVSIRTSGHNVHTGQTDFAATESTISLTGPASNALKKPN
jgi:hypothetical protein